MGKRLTGIVFSDLGRAAAFMAVDRVQASLSDKLGFSPYPGTLNLRLETESMIAAWRQIQQSSGIEIGAPDATFCRARCFLVEIEGKHQGAVILPEVENYPADKIEVVAPVRLKDALKVSDGRPVTLEFAE